MDNERLTVELGHVLQGVSKKIDKLAEVTGASDVPFLEDEMEIIESILHQVWDMEESTMEFDSWLGEVLFHVRRGKVDPNDLPKVIRNLKSNLAALPNEHCTFKIDGKTGDINNIRILPPGN